MSRVAVPQEAAPEVAAPQGEAFLAAGFGAVAPVADLPKLAVAHFRRRLHNRSPRVHSTMHSQFAGHSSNAYRRSARVSLTDVTLTRGAGERMRSKPRWNTGAVLAEALTFNPAESISIKRSIYPLRSRLLRLFAVPSVRMAISLSRPQHRANGDCACGDQGGSRRRANGEGARSAHRRFTRIRLHQLDPALGHLGAEAT